MTPVDPTEVAERVDAFRERLRRCGGQDIRVVAVTKTFDAGAIDAVVAAGLRDVGENYAQEAVTKLAAVASEPVVHFVGRLQRNKVRSLAPVVDVWQSVDRPALASEIAKRSPGASVMIQVDISGEDSKGGVAVAALPSLVEHVREMGLRLVGLMGVALLAEPEAARPGFRLLRRLADEFEVEHCSMGMSGDLEVAVDEGATMVRIGSDLFGRRDRH